MVIALLVLLFVALLLLLESFLLVSAKLIIVISLQETNRIVVSHAGQLHLQLNQILISGLRDDLQIRLHE